jgi:hypothetical protein
MSVLEEVGVASRPEYFGDTFLIIAQWGVHELELVWLDTPVKESKLEEGGGVGLPFQF